MLEGETGPLGKTLCWGFQERKRRVSAQRAFTPSLLELGRRAVFRNSIHQVHEPLLQPGLVVRGSDSSAGTLSGVSEHRCLQEIGGRREEREGERNTGSDIGMVVEGMWSPGARPIWCP